MNRERIQILRDHLAAIDDSKFTMSLLFGRWDSTNDEYDDATSVGSKRLIRTVIHDCGTAACIAGYAGALFSPNSNARNFGSNEAAELLGLPDWKANELFTPEGFSNHDNFTRQDAIQTLDHLLATGEVKWPS